MISSIKLKDRIIIILVDDLKWTVDDITLSKVTAKFSNPYISLKIEFRFIKFNIDPIKFFIIFFGFIKEIIILSQCAITQ